MLNSRIILAKGIKLDKSYNNVLNYTENQMVTLVENNKLYSNNTYSFIRPQNTIYVKVPYGTALQCNYMAFQNTDYSSKWFFAFINNVKYVSDNAVEIDYTVDSWATWFGKWEVKPCYVLREHVSDDIVGKYVQEEGLQLGEFIANKKNRWLRDSDGIYTGTDMVIVLGATENNEKALKGGVQTDGIYAGLRYYVFHNNAEGISDLNKWLEDYENNGTSDAIKCLYMLPEFLVTGADREDHLYAGSNIVTTKYINGEDGTNNKNIDLSNSTIDGYVPRNKKVLTYPYQYLLISNNNGVDVVYRLEDFYKIENGEKVQTIPAFKIECCVTPSGSVRMIPLNYKGVAENDIEGINLGKFPICSWQTDVYTNWLTQNGTNIGLQLAGAGVGIVSSAVTGNPLGIVSSSFSIANTIGEIYKESKIPPQANGNINAGDVITASGRNDFYFYNMSIKKEIAEVIDNYFDRFGYKISKVKVPNLTGRTYWNYVEIGANEVIGNGDVPAQFMEVINNACRRGITIWHNHSNIGNYNLNNIIKE